MVIWPFQVDNKYLVIKLKANLFINKNFSDHVTISEIIPLNILFTDLINRNKHVALLAIVVGYASWLQSQLIEPSLNTLFTKTTTICETMEAIY